MEWVNIGEHIAELTGLPAGYRMYFSHDGENGFATLERVRHMKSLWTYRGGFEDVKRVAEIRAEELIRAEADAVA